MYQRGHSFELFEQTYGVATDIAIDELLSIDLGVSLPCDRICREAGTGQPQSLWVKYPIYPDPHRSRIIMDFEGTEITQQEYEKWVEGWPERYKNNQPGLPAWKVFVASKKQQILEERIGIRVGKMVGCLQKYCAIAILSSRGDKILVKPDLTKPLPTKEQVNDFKVRVINFFRDELYQGKTVKPYWLEQGIDQLPPWEGLNESTWLNFYKEFHEI